MDRYTKWFGRWAKNTEESRKKARCIRKLINNTG